VLRLYIGTMVRDKNGSFSLKMDSGFMNSLFVLVFLQTCVFSAYANHELQACAGKLRSYT
jgi:hypothetical protein